MQIDALTREQAVEALADEQKVYAPVENVFMGIERHRRLLCPLTGTEWVDGKQIEGTFASALVLGQISVKRAERRKGAATDALMWLIEIAPSLGCSFVRINRVIAPEMERIAQRCGFTEAAPGVYDYVV